MLLTISTCLLTAQETWFIGDAQYGPGLRLQSGFALETSQPTKGLFSIGISASSNWQNVSSYELYVYKDIWSIWDRLDIGIGLGYSIELGERSLQTALPSFDDSSAILVPIQFKFRLHDRVQFILGWEFRSYRFTSQTKIIESPTSFRAGLGYRL